MLRMLWDRSDKLDGDATDHYVAGTLPEVAGTERKDEQGWPPESGEAN